MRRTSLKSELLRFIVENGYHPGDSLPTIQEISQTMDSSVAKTRESLEVARALGMVDIKPGRGIRVTEYTFTPAVTVSSLYAIGLDDQNFEHLRAVRNGIEISFWNDAVSSLTSEDVEYLRQLIATAREQLARQPIQVPADVHRRFHLTLFSRLENPFVQGILEAFWEAYEAFGLNLYADIDYHREVWDYHEWIVESLAQEDYEEGRLLLIEHMNLLQLREEREAADRARLHLRGFE
jgi:DNA-binding FadR family transcriptional regulator